MVFQATDSDNKPRYIKGRVNRYWLSRDSDGALDEVPEGWEIVELKSGRLSLKRER